MSKKISILAGLLITLLLPLTKTQAALIDDVSGRILLQVEKKGEAWYVNPVTKKLHFLGRPLDALSLMRELGLGITNADLDKLKGEGVHEGALDLNLSKRLAGKIVLQVENAGQAWYVNPVDLNRYYLGTPNDALRVFRELGLGISQRVFELLPKEELYNESLNRLNLAISKTNESISKDGSFTLLSPLSTETFGYLGKGKYYYSTKDGLMSEKEYLKSDGYIDSNKAIISSLILNKMLAIQTALELYRYTVKAYPLSQPGGDVVLIPGRNIFTSPNGFFGSETDDVVYFKDEVPQIPSFSYVYTSPNGSDYSLTFELLNDIDGFVKGRYVMTSAGIKLVIN